MRVAILSFYSGLIERGVETWAKNLKEKLARKVNIEIFGGEKFGSKVDWSSKRERYWRGLVLLHVFYTLPEWIKSDIVVPTNGTLQSVVCRLVTWVLGKPMIVFGHSGPGADDKFNLLCSPNVFVAFSSFQADWAKKFKLPWTKVVVIPHAVDTNVFRPAKKKVKENIVLCVAANMPDKRVDLVRNAVAEIPNAKFMAVGNGNEFRFPYSKMPEVYRKAKVFCFVPKSHEAFGLVYLEAMASNLPVVAIDDPIRREIVGSAGLFVENPEDVGKLSDAIQKALEIDWKDKPRRQSQKFGWDIIIDKYVDLFKNLSR